MYVQSTHPDPLLEKQKEFYSQQLDSDKEKLLLIGASHVGQLNVTKINEVISKEQNDYLVYNLAYVGDTPKKRSDSIEKILALKPKVVFYGISYRDFGSKAPDNSKLPKPDDLIKETLKIDTESVQFNPKFTTLQAIRDIFNDNELFAGREEISIPNTPFFTYNIEQITVVPNTTIDSLAGTTGGVGSYIDMPRKNMQLAHLKKILDAFTENNVKVVLFTTPLHQTYLNDLSDSTENNFELILEDIRENYKDIKIYDYTSKYSHLDIWANPDHIAYNKISMIYSDDITQMILNETDS